MTPTSVLKEVAIIGLTKRCSFGVPVQAGVFGIVDISNIPI